MIPQMRIQAHIQRKITHKLVVGVGVVVVGVGVVGVGVGIVGVENHVEVVAETVSFVVSSFHRCSYAG